MNGDFFIENNQFCSYWVCEKCSNQIKCCANKPYYLSRNLKNKKICKHCSLELQKGNKNPFFGKTHSNKSIQKISISKSGKKTSEHMSTPKYKELFSEMKKRLWDSGKMEHVRSKMSDLMKTRISNGEIKGYNRSKAEDEILNILKHYDIKCQPNFIIEGKIFDVLIEDLMLIIEYNGDYWHCNPEKYNENYFNKKKGMYAKEIWEYDKNKIDLARKLNYNCIIVWENDYKKNKNIIIDIIKNHAKKD